LASRTRKANQFDGIDVVLLCLALFSGSVAAYLWLRPGPPADWVRARAEIRRHPEARSDKTLVSWKDPDGKSRSADVEKCSIFGDGRYLSIAYRTVEDNVAEARSVCRQNAVYPFSLLAIAMGSYSGRHAWNALRWRALRHRHR